MAATLLISVGSGVIAAYAGLSMALGAFIAGLLLAETEYRRAVEAMIDPFRGLLLGVFFFSVGMHIDLGFIWREPLLVAGALRRHDRGQDGAARPALPAVRRAVGGQRRDQPAAGAGRRVRLHRHRPCRPGRPDRRRRGGGRAGRGVADHGVAAACVALFARRAGHRFAKRSRRPIRCSPCCRRTTTPGASSWSATAGSASSSATSWRSTTSPTSPPTATPPWSSAGASSAGRSITATPPTRCSCGAAASTRRWASSSPSTPPPSTTW